MHVITCPHLAVEKYQEEHQDLLWKAMENICTPPTILSYQKKGILSCDLYGVELESSSEENSSSSPSASPDYVSLIHEAFAQQTTELGGIICIMDAFQNFGVRPFTRSRWHGSDGLINGNRQQTW
jgi:hypothetical protein